MLHNPADAYVRCFWIGEMQLINGQLFMVQCTHISNKRVEVEVTSKLANSQKIKLELDAMHKGVSRRIKAICTIDLDVLNEHDKHFVKLHFDRISDADVKFIEAYIEAHA